MTTLVNVRRCANLGCGKCIFPTPAQCAAEPDTEWLNVDRLPLPGVDRQFDLFAYPWPLPDGHFDHLVASHLCEHIPHEPRFSPWATGRDWLRYQSQDGFFVWFAEAYRVLKPDGTIEVEVPHGACEGALQDPTHTRSILPTTISYLCQQPSPTYDYQLGHLFHWQCEWVRYAVDAAFDGLRQDEIERLAYRQRNVILAIAFQLRKLPLDQERQAGLVSQAEWKTPAAACGTLHRADPYAPRPY